MCIFAKKLGAGGVILLTYPPSSSERYTITGIFQKRKFYQRVFLSDTGS